MKQIAHIVLNNYENDNRVRRAAKTSSELGLTTHIFALSNSKSKKFFMEGTINVNLLFIRTRFLPKIFFSQVIKYLEINVRILISLLRCKPSIIHAHDLDTLLISYVAGKILNAKLIYDSHEYWFDSGYFKKNSFKSFFAFRLENFLIKRANSCITVSESIAILLKNNYKIETPTVVRNIPEKWNNTNNLKLRSELNIDNSTILILYQGGINGEGVFDLINAFKNLNSKTALVYLGNGPAVSDLKKMNVPNVYFKSSVAYDQLPYYTSDADIGVHSMHGSSTNNIYALPNKLFEYIQGVLPVIISDLPEMSNIVNKFNLGLTYKFGDINSLSKCLTKLVIDNEFRLKLKENVKKASLILNWEEEKKKLVNIYNKY